MKNRIRNMLLISSAVIATAATGCGLAAVRTGNLGWMYVGVVGSWYMTLFCYANKGYLARKIARWLRKRQKEEDDRFMLQVQQLIWMTIRVENVDGIYNERREVSGSDSADIIPESIYCETEQDGCAEYGKVLGKIPIGEDTLLHQRERIG